MKQDSLFEKSDNPILKSIHTYKQALMNDIHLSIRVIYNHETYMTHLVDWTKNLIILEAPMKGIDYVILPNQTSLEATLVAKTALFHTSFRILKKYKKENSLYYVAEIIAPLTKRQQREAFRLDVLLDVHYTSLPSDKNMDKSTGPITGKGTCLNISVGGMCLACNHQFHSKEKIQTKFKFIDQSLNLTGEVLFLGEPNEVPVYHHRIRFLNMTSADKNLLNKLIFQKQQLELKYQTT